VDGGHQRGPHALEGVLDGIQFDDLAPGRADGFDPGPDPRQDLAQQQAEAAEVHHQHRLSRRHQRHQRRLDPGPGGAIDQEGLLILRAEDRPIQRHDLVHVRGHLRIELAQQVGGHGAQHARMGIDRARAHQQALRRIDLGKDFRCHGLLPIVR